MIARTAIPTSANVLTQHALRQYKWVIGIDPGVQTGFAMWMPNEKRFWIIQTLSLHEAIRTFFLWQEQGLLNKMFVRIEDARQRKWFGKSDREQLQGAGSIKRDCKIWEDFLTDLKIDFEMVEPKNNKTKMNADLFKKITGWKDKTNEHSRDAAMLVYGVSLVVRNSEDLEKIIKSEL